MAALRPKSVVSKFVGVALRHGPGRLSVGQIAGGVTYLQTRFALCLNDFERRVLSRLGGKMKKELKEKHKEIVERLLSVKKELRRRQ